MTAPDCSCLERGPQYPDATIDRDVGVDETAGRFAAVDVIRCTRCRRLWLKYLVEYEHLTAAGRWAAAPIDEAAAAAMTPESAVAYIEAAGWLLFGGSYWGHAGNRGSGRIAHWL